MLLSVDIVIEQLKQLGDFKCKGTLQSDVLLGRPRFVVPGDRVFSSGNLYVGMADNLPRHPEIEHDIMLVSIGGSPPPVFFNNHCMCLIAPPDANAFSVFNVMTELYDRLDDWDERLNRSIDDAEDLSVFIELGEEVLSNPLLLLNERFFYVAFSKSIETDERLADFRPHKDGYADFTSVREALKTDLADIVARDIMRSKTSVHLISKNLFLGERYTGSLTEVCINNDPLPSDEFFISHLASKIEATLRHNPVLRINAEAEIRDVVHNLVRGYPVDASDWHRVKDVRQKEFYLCTKAVLNSSSREVPVEYICNVFETLITGCIAFPHADSVVAVVNCSDEELNTGTPYFSLLKVVKEIDVVVGVSAAFSDLSCTRSYYRQASIALEKGLELGGDEGLYLFDRFAVSYMVENSCGEFDSTMLYRRGLEKLVAHDRDSQSNYILTLRTYLDNNMRITETARQLYIHRTTLMARLRHIESMIVADLNDANDRLQLMINLRAMKENGA